MNVYASATSHGAVTPSDTVVLEFRAIYIGVGGNVAVKVSDQASAVTYVGIPTGTILPIKGGIVMNTNTTATNIVWMNW